MQHASIERECREGFQFVRSVGERRIGRGRLLWFGWNQNSRGINDWPMEMAPSKNDSSDDDDRRE
jgi:hypothetical protein